MHDMTKPKPRPGSLPLPKIDSLAELAPLHPAQSALPPWLDEEPKQVDGERALTALRAARAKAEELAQAVRNAAFDDWVRRCVVTAREPSDWTQARVLYESYLAHAKAYGRTRADRALSVLELATETQWGRMMATLFVKKRRSAGWYYPLRCKRGG